MGGIPTQYGVGREDTAEAREIRRVRAEFAAKRIADLINDRFGAALTPDEVRGFIVDNWRTVQVDAHRIHEGGTHGIS